MTHLRDEKIEAPLIPSIKDPFDTSNFEKMADTDNDIPDETSGWDADF